MFEYMRTVLNGFKAWVTGEVNKLLSKIDAVGAVASRASNAAAKNKSNIAELAKNFNNIVYSVGDAQITANEAQTAADNAQTTANTAQTTANSAKTAADNAQTAANAAKTAADTALERVVEPYMRNAQMAPLYKNGGFSDWRWVVQEILYDETEGFFFADMFNITALKEEDMPNAVFCTEFHIERRYAKAFLSCITTGSSWSVRGFAIITEDCSRAGEILYVSANTISLNEAKGLFLTFRAPDSMLLKSSTVNSTKQFRITVDDTGTLTATEVTTS